MSFGVLQWNIGQGTLQPMLNEMFSSHPDIVSTTFAGNLGQLQQALAEAKMQYFPSQPPSRTRPRRPLPPPGSRCSEPSGSPPNSVPRGTRCGGVLRKGRETVRRLRILVRPGQGADVRYLCPKRPHSTVSRRILWLISACCSLSSRRRRRN